ncbi:MAG: 3-dehydroquinate synthase [Betaproteobacteria bacterium]|nr:3-dehydroquinate synthase [Betaproteobacteria bacterium]
MPRIVNVALGERAYPIHIGEHLIEALPALLRGRAISRIAVVTNPTVAELYLPRTEHSFAQAGFPIVTITIPDGEAHKTVATWTHVHDCLLAARLDRKSAVLALGGGVVGDIAGFAAATYQRGISFIQVPTTLLAQVDSSVGGKTGVNHPLGKNMIGAFYQPELVVIDTSTLATLPLRELRAGLAEVIKYGLIRDRDFFAWLEANAQALLARDPAAMAHAIEVSCRHKAEVVANDETEQGERALLNLGHTFGHAIEAGLGYGTWLHGEAVAAGTVMAARLSARLGWLPEPEVDRIASLFSAVGLPIEGPAFGADRYLELMAHDKKVIAGNMRLILLRAMGEGVVTSDAPVGDVRAVLP